MSKAIKYSKQREALKTLLCSTTCHPDAVWLYEGLKKDFPNISLATVYRNLALLSTNKEILTLDIRTGTEHYDGNPDNHYHFVCKKCGRVIDLDLEVDDELNQRVSDAVGMRIYDHSLLFHGICDQCEN